DSCLCQPFPWEGGAWVLFALRRNVAMADHIAGEDLVACDDVAEQAYEDVDLLVGIRFTAVIDRAAVVDLHTNGCGIRCRPAIPLAFASVPGAAAFINQLIDAGRGFVRDQIMAADVSLRENIQGPRRVGHGVVQNEFRHPAALTDSLDAAVYFQALGAG